MKEVSLKQAALIFNCSTKTIRRRIHAGKLSARLVSGAKGPEYRIRLPENFSDKTVAKSETSHRASCYENFIGTEFISRYENTEDKTHPNNISSLQQQLRELTAKYEQALILIGRLQAELDKKVPQLEAEASSLKEKYDLLKLQHEEKVRKLKEHEQKLQTKEYVITELAKELDNAQAELKKRESPLFLIKRLFRLA